MRKRRNHPGYHIRHVDHFEKDQGMEMVWGAEKEILGG